MNNEDNLLESLEKKLRECTELIEDYRKSRPRSRGSFEYQLEVVIGSKTFNTGKNSDIYVSAIESIGIEKAYEVCKKHHVRQGRFMAVSDRDNPTYRCRKIDKYYIITANNSQDKERILNEIIDHLRLNDKVTVNLMRLPKNQN